MDRQKNSIKFATIHFFMNIFSIFRGKEMELNNINGGLIIW